MDDERLAALSAAQGGVVLRHQALDLGVGSDEIRDLVRSRAWTRVRHGAYAETRTWQTLDPAGRALMRCHAVRARFGPEVVFAASSSALIQGLQVRYEDLDEQHVMRPGATSRREAGLVHHRWPAAGVEPVLVDGFLVTPPARAVIEVAEVFGFEAGVVVGDSALRLLINREELLETFEPLRNNSGARIAGRVVSFVDGRAENGGESVSRVRLVMAGLPQPRLQIVILDAHGPAGRSDLWVEEYNTAGEFDGMLKYRVPVGADPDEASLIVMREKAREDRIRSTGAEVVRWTHRELERPGLIVARFHAAFERGRRLIVPVRWQPTPHPRHPRG
ncbi:MAG TPA: type IV toxin-antitoxin system AbiEi family antitoxin domain-containing protein [Jiangellales bacterium]|nr:type IV toxin-antitoxin system AbiEi family antitoxin domain-containing protein [Jiangellales bacterium]